MHRATHLANAVFLAALAVPAEGHIQVLAPNGGEVLAGGASATIRWDYPIQHGAGTVDISFSSDGGQNWQPRGTVGFPAVMWEWRVPNLDTTRGRIMLEYRAASGGAWSDTSDADFRVESRCQLATDIDPLIGSAFRYRVDCPGRGGLSAQVLLSCTGQAQTLALPGGVAIQLDLDFCTTFSVANPAIFLLPLDSLGQGTSPPIAIPGDPLLQGAQIWSAAVVLSPLAPQPFVAGTPTHRFSIG